ncbi:MAG: class I SAM-dependent methyltransferase [Syntrophaceae bacterium]
MSGSCGPKSVCDVPDDKPEGKCSNVRFQQSLYSSQNPTRRYLHQRRKQILTDWIRTRGKGSRTLEIGIGGDVYGPCLREHSRTLYRLDMEREYISHAKSSLPPSSREIFIVGDATALPFRAASFDLILISEVIEHLPPQKSVQALRELKRVKCPSGTILLSTPQKYSTIETIGRFIFGTPLQKFANLFYSAPTVKDTGHTNSLTQRALLAQFREADLRVLEKTLCGFYIPLLAELGGDLGADIARFIEDRIRESFLGRILWTQLYLLN